MRGIDGMNNEVIPDLKDPDGWTVENNPHPSPEYCRVYNDKDGSNWIDYMEYFGVGEYICHSCIARAKYGKREKLRRKYSQKRDVQTKRM